ncbi:MAG: HDIG domain-containing protein [bacterium]|nr:HDIG domain-containing protein [bacterium]
MTFDLNQAEELVQSRIKNKNLLKHMYAVQASMKALAKELKEDEELWELVGLVHDVDYEETMNTPEKHGEIGVEILKEAGYPPEVTDAVLAHVGNVERDTNLKKAIFAVDSLTGLIVACALIKPEKKIDLIETDFVIKKMGEKKFAAGANRESIKACSELGFSLEQFIDITLTAMKSISGQLGL